MQANERFALGIVFFYCWKTAEGGKQKSVLLLFLLRKLVGMENILWAALISETAALVTLIGRSISAILWSFSVWRLDSFV